MRRVELLFRFLFACLLLLVTAVSLHAQTATGEIVGRITDIKGAVIIGAKITATDIATQRVRTTTSNAEGNFQFPLLPPGNYEVAAEFKGMSKSLVKLELLVGAHQTVNLTLKPGATETIVEVTGAAPPVDTTSSEIKANVDPKQMAELPLNGRTFASLAILAPGVRPVGSFDPTKSRIGTVSINGSAGRNFNMTVDGGDNKDNIVGGFVQNFTTEGIQEFVIDTHKFGADTGKSSGGVLTLVTKGGSNELHGTGFFFFRNRNLNAMDYFTAQQDNPQKAPFDKDNYGGSIGGPIKKNKLFFFSSIEHTREMSSVAQNVSTLDALSDFVALRKVAPLSYPELQNLPIDLSPSIPVPFLDTQYQVRMDWTINEKNQAFFRYAQQNNHLANDQLTGWADVSNGGTTINDLNSFLASWTAMISPTKLNQFVFQYSHFFNGMYASPSGLNTTEVCFNNGTCIGQGENVPQTTTQNKLHFRDDFTWRLGNHSMKFGGQNIYTPSVGGTIAYDVTPWVYLNCDPAAILANRGLSYKGTPGGCGEAMSFDDDGVAYDIGLAGGNPSYMEHNINQISYYFQDDWQVTKRLTLNLGVRNDIDYGLVPTGQQLNNRAVKLLRAIGQDPGVPTTDTNNWAPRFGFAWDVTGKSKWVIRGGYGWYFDQPWLNMILQAYPQGNPDVYAVLYEASYDGIGIGPGLDAAKAAVGQWPIAHEPDLPYGSRGRFLDHSLQTPYNQQMTVGTQFDFGHNLSLNVDYLHLLGLHEFAQKEVNPETFPGDESTRILLGQIDPLYGCQQDDGSIVFPTEGATTCDGLHKLQRISEMTSDSRSRYDSLTFQFKGKVKNTLTFGASYVLARALGYGGSASGQSQEAQGIFPGLTGWQTALKGIIGPQDFAYAGQDERHRLVLNGILELKGGFLLSGIAQFSSGRPISIGAGRDLNGDGVNNDVYSNIITGDPTFDPKDWGDARYSSFMKSQIRGDPYYQTDIRVQKTFTFRDRYKLALLADMFNVFNHVNFGDSYVSGARSLSSDVPANVRGCYDSQGNAVSPPCTFATAQQLPRVPASLFGGGYGGAGTVGIPFQAQFGLRLSF